MKYLYASIKAAIQAFYFNYSFMKQADVAVNYVQ